MCIFTGTASAWSPKSSFVPSDVLNLNGLSDMIMCCCVNRKVDCCLCFANHWQQLVYGRPRRRFSRCWWRKAPKCPPSWSLGWRLLVTCFILPDGWLLWVFVFVRRLLVCISVHRRIFHDVLASRPVYPKGSFPLRRSQADQEIEKPVCRFIVISVWSDEERKIWR
jgi:hypothetical protein